MWISYRITSSDFSWWFPFQDARRTAEARRLVYQATKARVMAPQPIWGANIRISGAAVNRLYHRLSHLEEVFAINDYPYVGRFPLITLFCISRQARMCSNGTEEKNASAVSSWYQSLRISDPRARAKNSSRSCPDLRRRYWCTTRHFLWIVSNTDIESNPSQMQAVSGQGGTT